MQIRVRETEQDIMVERA